MTGGDERRQAAVVDSFLDDHLGCLRRRLAARARRSHVDVDDVVHDTLERALRHAHVFSSPDHMFAWCVRTGLRRIGEIRRAPDERRHVPLADMTRTCDAAGATSPDPADLVEADERAEMIRSALARLPDRDQWLLAAWSNRLSYREMAVRLGLTEAAVTMRLHRARRRLRSEMRALKYAAAGPLFVLHRLRRVVGARRWHSGVPVPVSTAGVMVVTTAVVLHLAVPLPGPAPAYAAPPAPAPTQTALDGTSRGLLYEPAADPRAARTVPRRSRQANRAAPTTPAAGCRPAACLLPDAAPPIPRPTLDPGDVIYLRPPGPVDDILGDSEIREDYLPVCDLWIDTELAYCESSEASRRRR